LYENEWVIDFKGRTNLADWWFDYTIIKEKHNTLGFHLYLVDIHGLLDREKIYGYSDDIERFTAFQIVVVNWLSHWQKKPDIGSLPRSSNRANTFYDEVLLRL
jgi:starch synthase